MFWANFSKILFCLDFGHKNKKCDKKNFFEKVKKNFGKRLFYCFPKFHENSSKN